MRVISFIEQPEIIEKILKHLDLWETRNHDPPTRKATHIPELIIDPSYLPCSIKRNVSSILLFESAVKGKYHMTFDPSI